MVRCAFVNQYIYCYRSIVGRSEHSEVRHGKLAESIRVGGRYAHSNLQIIFIAKEFNGRQEKNGALMNAKTHP